MELVPSGAQRGGHQSDEGQDGGRGQDLSREVLCDLHRHGGNSSDVSFGEVGACEVLGRFDDQNGLLVCLNVFFVIIIIIIIVIIIFYFRLFVCDAEF